MAEGNGGGSAEVLKEILTQWATQKVTLAAMELQLNEVRTEVSQLNASLGKLAKSWHEFSVSQEVLGGLLVGLAQQNERELKTLARRVDALEGKDGGARHE